MIMFHDVPRSRPKVIYCVFWQRNRGSNAYTIKFTKEFLIPPGFLPCIATPLICRRHDSQKINDVTSQTRKKHFPSVSIPRRRPFKISLFMRYIPLFHITFLRKLIFISWENVLHFVGKCFLFLNTVRCKCSNFVTRGTNNMLK